MNLRALSILVLLLPNALFAQTSAEQAADQLEAATIKLETAQGARDRVAALTETVRAYETGLVSMREGLRQAAIQKRRLENELALREEEISRLVGVLQTLGRSPESALLLHPDGPTGMARSSLIAAEVTPSVQAQADALAKDLSELAVLQGLQDSAAATLERGLKGAQSARAELSAAISNRTDLPKRFIEDPVQTSLLIASAETLAAFASSLSETYAVENNSVYSTDVKGGLAAPLQGQITRGFNAPDVNGVTRPGITFAGRAKALVTAPTPATVLFVGPLLDYGNVAILEPAPDVLFVFAGLAEIYSETGQVIPAGHPIGILGGSSPNVDAILTESESGNLGAATQSLYLEVREGQSPVDPAIWFALN